MLINIAMLQLKDLENKKSDKVTQQKDLKQKWEEEVVIRANYLEIESLREFQERIKANYLKLLQQ